MKATARAHPNIALVKYWGKRDDDLVLPHQSSLSVTLGPLAVTTTVQFRSVLADEVTVNGRRAAGTPLARVIATLDLVRSQAPGLGPARVVSTGDFPEAAGLASSAAAFAALAIAARTAAGLGRDTRAESILARRGSGSAARSIEGGVCVWHRGLLPDGTDSYAQQKFPPEAWPELRLVVGVVSTDAKDVKSRDGMKSAVETSPFYGAWVQSAEADIAPALRAFAEHDLASLGTLAERNAWRMHAVSMAADPPLCYLRPSTLEVIEGLRALRRDGVAAYFTLDAGPNPVVLTLEANVRQVVTFLEQHGSRETRVCKPGGDAVLVKEHLF